MSQSLENFSQALPKVVSHNLSDLQCFFFLLSEKFSCHFSRSIFFHVHLMEKFSYKKS